MTYRRGRHVLSARYRRRVNAVGPATLTHRNTLRGVFKRGLQRVTKEQLYDRTPLPVTMAMYNSIKTRQTAEGIDIYYDRGVAYHAPYRVNMTGISVTGGHLLNMTPAETLELYTRNERARLNRAAIRAIHQA